MNRTLLAAAATLALAVPGAAAMAQDTTTGTTANASAMSAQQRTMYDGWPADRRTSYDAWPATYRTYYWSLTPEQQNGWWALTDEQRGQIYAMTPEQRSTTWASVVSQMSGQTAPPPMSSQTPTSATASTPGDATGDMATMDQNATATTSSGAAMADTSMTAAGGQLQFVRREMTQPVTASADAAALQSGDLPVCKKNQQDGCINSWEKNRTGTRPLDRWPGRPASERR